VSKPFDDSFLQIGPLKAAYYSLLPENNSLPKILCFHGFTGSGEDFRSLQDSLIGNYELIVCDWIGHGLSDGPDCLDFYSVNYSNALTKAAIHRCQESGKLAGLLGYSMGSRLLASFITSENNPEISHLPKVFIGLSPGLLSKEERQARLEQDHEWHKILMLLDIRGFAEKWESQSIISPQLEIPQPYRDEISARRRRNSSVGLANSILGYSPGIMKHFWDRLDQLENSSILTGRADTKYCHQATAILKKNPKINHTVITNSGHSPHIEQPAKTADTINKFILGN
jgi:2-succinyl-6-hydroxy-2,4-cyclohexadiene-1-carboxylate synthase